MSFDLELMCFKNKEPASFPTIIVEQAMGPFIQERDDDFCTLLFPDGGGGEMLNEEETQTNGVSIGDASGRDIYNALFEIMRRTNTVLIWSFGGCAVADPTIIPHLPPELVDAQGQPVVVRNGGELADAVEDS